MQFDVKTAFLYGELEEIIFMKQPEGFSGKEDYVCRLNKTLYGRKHAPSSWSKTFNGFLQQFKLQPSWCDPFVFIGTWNREQVSLLLCVDDGLIMAKNKSTV